MEVNNNEHPYKNKVHRVLAHSYTVYLLLFLLGLSLDLVFQFKIFNGPVMMSLGTTLFIFATFLIFWAQKSSRNLKIKKENISKETFCDGPYCYTRSPTHWGLFFLMLGFGITTNSFFVILFALVSLFVTRFVFLDQEEKILEEKYGVHYLEYKKSVKL